MGSKIKENLHNLYIEKKKKKETLGDVSRRGQASQEDGVVLNEGGRETLRRVDD